MSLFTRADAEDRTDDERTVRIARKRFVRRQWARRWLAWRRVVAALVVLALVVGAAWTVFFSSVSSRPPYPRGSRWPPSTSTRSPRGWSSCRP
jgi:uncharacterized membrane protein